MAERKITKEQFERLTALKDEMKAYLSQGKFDRHKHFGVWLKDYKDVIGLSMKDLGDDISMNQTAFSLLVNGVRKPNNKIFLRLAYHCNEYIPFMIWYQLYSIETLHELQNNKELRDEAAKVVKPLGLNIYF